MVTCSCGMAQCLRPKGSTTHATILVTLVATLCIAQAHDLQHTISEAYISEEGELREDLRESSVDGLEG